MKKILIFALPFFMYAADMPPMPPAIPNIGSHKTIQKSSTQNSNLPKSCQMIPPMIYKLPPPLENLLDKCKNDMHMPKAQTVKTTFGKDIKGLHVVALKDFSKLYQVSFLLKGKKNIKYCNETLTYCFETSPKKISHSKSK